MHQGVNQALMCTESAKKPLKSSMEQEFVAFYNTGPEYLAICTWLDEFPRIVRQAVFTKFVNEARIGLGI